MARIRRRKRGGIWQAYYYDRGGTRQWASTHTTNKRTAQAIADRIERAAHDPDPAPEDPTTLGDALKLLLKDRLEQVRAGKRSEATVRMYRAKAGQLLRVFEMDELDERVPFRIARLTAAHVDEFISRRRDELIKEHTIAKELVTLRAALKLCKRRGLWGGDLSAVMPDRFSPEYTPRERFLTTDELPKLLAELPNDYAARACLCIATSANDSESSRVFAEDLVGEAITIRGSKTENRWRVVPIATDWQRELLAYAREHTRGAEGELFAHHTSDGFYHALGRACAAAEIPRCSSNDLRRTFAHWMRAAGVPLELIAPAMGHATTQMLQRVYGKPTPAELASLMTRATGDTPVTQTAAHRVDSTDSVDTSAASKPAKVVPEEGLEPTSSCERRILSPLGELPKPRADKRKRARDGRADTPVTQQSVAEVIALATRRRA